MDAFITVSVNWFNAFIIAAINYRLSELSTWSYYLTWTHRAAKDINCMHNCVYKLTYAHTKRNARFFLFFLFVVTARRQLKTDKFSMKQRERKRFGGRRGYIDSWGGWISDSRSVSGRWRCFTIEDNAQKTIRQFQTAFPGGINRSSFKPSALFVLPFLNPRLHHPAAVGASPVHVHVTYEYGVTTLIIEVSRKTSM